MFIYMYTYNISPPVLHATLAPCMNNAIGSRASQGGLACILWPHHESCMHLLAPSWVFKPETPTCMSLAMTFSGPKAFIPWFRQNSAGIKVFVRTTLDFLWIWWDFAGRPKNLAEFRKFRWRKTIKKTFKIIKNKSRVFSENLQFTHNCHQIWRFSQKENQTRTKNKLRAF